MTLILAAVASVLLLSAFCSLLEAVLYSVPAGHVEGMIEAGRPSGRILRQLRARIDAPIAAILSLNTIAHTVGAAVAGALVASHYGEGALGVFSIAFTLAVLLVSEILPKTAGVVHARGLAAFTAYAVRGLVLLLAPLVWLCRLTTALVPGGRGLDAAVSDRELILLSNAGLRAGTIDAGEAAVIKNILTIESKTARDIMIPLDRLETLSVRDGAKDAAARSAGFRLGRVPVVDDGPDDLVGLLHRPKLLGALAAGREELRVEDLMSPLAFARASIPLDRLLRLFLRSGERVLALLDDEGRVVGAVTIDDVLEGVLGEPIPDETERVVDVKTLARRRRARPLD